MVKLVVLVKKKEGMSSEEFHRYWKENHGPLALKTVPELKKYVQNHTVKMGKSEPPYDGMAEIWFENMDAYRAYLSFYMGDSGKVIRDDEDRFLDKNKMVVFTAEENVMKE